MRVYVGNLSAQVTDAQLNDIAVPYGTLVSASVVTETSSGVSKGFGFIEFTHADQARSAIVALNGRELHGHVLEVYEAKPRRESAGSVPVPH